MGWLLTTSLSLYHYLQLLQAQLAMELVALQVSDVYLDRNRGSQRGLFFWPIGPRGTPVWRRDRRWGERVKQRTKSAWNRVLSSPSRKWHHQLQPSRETLLYLNKSSLFKARNDQKWMNCPRWCVITRARPARRDIFVLFTALPRANGSLG